MEAGSAIQLKDASYRDVSMVARQRNGMSRIARTAPRSDHVLYADDYAVDFGAAGLYVVGFQAVLATLTTAAVAVASCSLLPHGAASAVRTLAVTVAFAAFSVRSPLRLGRVRGVMLMFNSLRPCVATYILALILEQLVHACADDGLGANTTAGWREISFHGAVLIMVTSGFLRAYRPRSETDLPFLATLGAVVVLGLVPPATSAPSGPLCGSLTLYTAGERLLRATLFASVYAVHVYCSPAVRNAPADIVVCVVRAAAASIWILAAHVALLVLAPIQAVLALWRSFGSSFGSETYQEVDVVSDGSLDIEDGSRRLDDDDVVAEERVLAESRAISPTPSFSFQHLRLATAASKSPEAVADEAFASNASPSASIDGDPALFQTGASGFSGFQPLAPAIDAIDDPPREPESVVTEHGRAVPIDARDLANLTNAPSLRVDASIPRAPTRAASTLNFSL